MEPALIWKFGLALGLIAVICISACARAPKRKLPIADLRAMVFSALVLYAVGLGAALSDHAVIAASVYSCGIAVSAFAAWLSRGSDSAGPGGGGSADKGPPPSEPGPGFDWVSFERQFRDYTRRREQPPVPTG
jgi:hypothetical protein